MFIVFHLQQQVLPQLLDSFRLGISYIKRIKTKKFIGSLTDENL